MPDTFNTIPEALSAIENGEMIIVVDEPDRENEGDLIMAAEKVTAETINFMAKYGRGLICLPTCSERLAELELQPMVAANTAQMQTAFTVTIDAKEVTTGISAQERAYTIQKFVDADAVPSDFVRPGHIFPLDAKPGGVLRRAGHTEATVDLARMAGLYPAGVLCEILNEDGTMARVPELMVFAAQHELKIITISDLIAYRRQTETLIRRVATADIPTAHGEFKLYAYESTDTSGESVETDKTHIALTKGDIADATPLLVRVHSQCLTGDVFGSLRCDCGEQLEIALQTIEKEGRGVVLYMRQEGRGMGLKGKLRAYQLQDNDGLDTVEANEHLGYPADLRDYGIGAQILADLGVQKMRLMTNNPQKVKGLDGYGLEIVERVPLQTKPNPFNRRYLETKRSKLGHLLLDEE
ncbi:bifunctional 3,4-dihydroxy-2-butanone-4-phosphate synthase/GTP cyclohydrolase II [Candidatus Poribacteria bacterium]|nr:bifunctional 3,4-dihydroxy-2-butanone-4-phosphate synthase/GTP cyclohydrolase II [Candidatus Poribacteria bacterium]MYG05165.1 bifunctional 3,4-dihydroxy-2-butanone-4-phosphate synthase/GTP cyclohydrolase II [Candidatus Poribacteria bacterium]MYK22111.1 bifunctional 3,4-dihydroxy-2-butanone-4-phosphate synthase/GTP cyclohydrolase II [Candidatus Poribacteria bacterium]